MRFLTLFLAFFYIGTCNAANAKLLTYIVISDEYNADVPPGMVKIIGTVYNQTQFPLTKATIFTINEEKKAEVNDQGRYELLISTSDQAIFLFAPEFKEVLIDSYDFKSQHIIVINFHAIPVDSSKIIEREPVISFKPLIYLYSDSPQNANLNLNYLGELTFTYPPYNQGWNISVNEHGMKDAVSGRSFPYLFWEGEMATLNYLSNNGELQGAFLKTDTLISYLEHQLTDLGLNQTEKTDFITFWGPRMQHSPYVFMQFLVDDEYANIIAKLKVTPKPDNMRRIYLLFTGYDLPQKMELKPQKFTKFKRNGFTVVEWGGSEIKLHHEG